MPQFFKETDPVELQFYDAGEPVLSATGVQLDSFEELAYEAGPLGDILWTLELAPLAKAIKQEIFRDSFKQLFESFTIAGTFESYITVFTKIFGEAVEIDFTVPGPGRLQIDIVAEGLELSDLVVRYIEDNAYVIDELIDDEGDNIAVQTVKGFQTQYELEQMLKEMVPGGIVPEINLTLGGA